jgi:polygalacturonase
VRAFGAQGDGVHLDTAAIQSAVDASAKAGGGAVWFAPGTYRSGTIRLRDRVRLHLAGGATLLGSTDLTDYPPMVPKLRSFTDTYTDKSLIYAEGLVGAGLEGDGVIDGQGASFHGPYKVRPYLIRFVECRDVGIRDIELRNSPMWVQHYLGCEGVRISGVRVRSRVNENNDGIDIDASSGVRISDCDIVSGDDAIVLKSTAARPCRDVVVTNCVLSSLCNALKLGTESTGGFDSISISNCAVYDTRLAGIALETVDGAILDRVTVSNIVMRNVKCPIFVRLGDRARPYTEGIARPAPGALRNVVIQGVQAEGANPTGCALCGLPEHPIENLTLRDIALSFAGGGTAADAARDIPEEAAKYPEYKMFGPLPAYGLFARHIQGLRIENVRCVAAAADARPALICDHVRDLEVNGFSGASGIAPLVRLKDTRDARLRGLSARASLVDVIGSRSARIAIMCPPDRVDVAAGVPKAEVAFADR